MDDKIVRIAMSLAAMDGVPPKHFHAHDESFKIEYYRRAYVATEAYESALSDAGYAIVPKMATDLMLDAAFDLWNDQEVWEKYPFPSALWREMIAAAPNTTDRSEPTAHNDPL